jgi:hypothetical protein
MAWQLQGKITHGEEFNDGVPIPGCRIVHSNCEHCGTEVISVTDGLKSGWYPYLGNQAEIGKNYLYSPAVEAIRKFHDVGWIDIREGTHRENGPSFTQRFGNNLVNIHSRLHVRREGERKLLPPWQHQSGDAYRCLCNNCFKRTYRRIAVKGPGNLVYELTVLPTETIEQVVKECKIHDVQRYRNGLIILMDD